MPPRLQPPSRAIQSILRLKRSPLPRQYATAVSVSSTTPITPPSLSIPVARYPTTQPPSFKPPQFRKSQLLRQYASLLQSTPVMLLFQHNSIRSSEWVGLRRELAKALQKVDRELSASGAPSQNVADGIKIQIIQTGIFAAALKVVEYYTPEEHSEGDSLTHVLSRAAHEAVANKKTAHALAPLLAGPLAVVTFPTVSPQHLAAAISVLAPSKGDFPAPTRRDSPGWHDTPVQMGLQKLMLMGARVEGKVFDVEGTKWVGGISGGLDGLRGQLVAMLQSVSAGVTNTLESAAKNLYFTVESRRTMLEDEGKETLEDGVSKAEKKE